jgi:hypothetical protein
MVEAGSAQMATLAVVGMLAFLFGFLPVSRQKA